jgi:hypothetical protein
MKLVFWPKYYETAQIHHRVILIWVMYSLPFFAGCTYITSVTSVIATSACHDGDGVINADSDIEIKPHQGQLPML